MLNRNEKVLKEINSVLEQISKTIQAERSLFFILNKDQGQLECLLTQGTKNVVWSVDPEQLRTGSVLSTGKSMVDNKVPSDPKNSVDVFFNFTTKRILGVPVFDENGSVLGVLQSTNKKEADFTEKDIKILTSFASAIALIIKNNELYLASEQIKNDFSTLLDVFKAISSELNLNKLIQVIMTKAAEITDSDRSSLFLLEEATGELWTMYAKGLEDIVVRTKKGVVAQVATSKKPSIVNKPYENPHFDPSIDKKTKYRTKSILSAPVYGANSQLLGVIQTVNKNSGVYDQADLNILTGFASQIRIAIENAKLFDQIQGVKNHLDILVQNLDNGIVTVDRTFRISTVNDTFAKMFGLKDVQDLNNISIDALDKELLPLFKYCKKTIKTGEKNYYQELKVVSRNKQLITVNLSVLPMQDAKKNIIGAIVVFNDISKEKRIQSNLSRYIPQHLVKDVMNQENLSLLKGNFSQCSILFSDIRNFTTLTEEFGAIQIVALLNKYFEAMLTSIYKYNGVLDKYIGDAIMTVFGVPYANISDAKNAVNCALDMFLKLEDLNQNNQTQPVLQIGVGISTGKVVSGNIGSEKRFEYTVIGDSVNLAARLESATKQFGVPLLICEETFKEVEEDFYCREVDDFYVKGKHNPVRVFSVMGKKTKPLSIKQQQFLENYKKGLSSYKRKQFNLALQFFQLADALMASDGPTKVFLNRCKEKLQKTYS